MEISKLFSRDSDGFTLVEILLVVAILTVLTAIGAPLYGSLQNTTELDVDTNTVVQDLYQAQAFSRAEQDQCSWGVAINNQTVSLFCGPSYATRDISRDYNYVVPSAVHLTGLQEISYSKLYGTPSITGTITVTTKGKTSNIVINSKGMLEY